MKNQYEKIKNQPLYVPDSEAYWVKNILISSNKATPAVFQAQACLSEVKSLSTQSLVLELKAFLVRERS